ARLRELYRAAADGRDAPLDEVLVASGMSASCVTPAQRAPLRDLTRMWARPGIEPDFDFGDRAYLEELAHLQHRLAPGRTVAIPPVWVSYPRQVIGVTSLLYRPGARPPPPFVDQFRALLDGAAPAPRRAPVTMGETPKPPRRPKRAATKRARG